MALGRRSFYRPTAILSERFTPAWIASIVGVIVMAVWIGYMAHRKAIYSQELWWTFSFDAHTPRMLRASLTVIILAAAYLLLNMLRPARPEPAVARPEDLERARKVIATSDLTMANAALAGDKRLLFSESQETFVMYQIAGRSWVALGDPVGAEAGAEELVWRFREISDYHGGETVFYQASSERLSLVRGPRTCGTEDRRGSPRAAGEFRPRRLRPSGPPAGASPRRARRRELRGHSARAPRRNPADLAPIVGLLARPASPPARSASPWEPSRAEYLRNFPIALVYCEGMPAAFANLWTTGTKDELSVDLMRFGPDAPRGAMDYLFIELMKWGRAQGYRWFNLGMAPLAGLEVHPLAPAWHRVGNFVFRHGEHFYNFDGLRRYKSKFDPVWEGKYLVARGGISLPRVLVDVSVLIAGGMKELFAR